ncbi:MarR family winged helix-turn-helix transcriptional regulator [Clostridium tagluense]|uniref:MarR family winged helix-turn-helix transcriptional regulator n=1 Tax=Clostridium tagluense TaxID=360422 RepID=UPI001CF4F63A|nr:MarR family transcriptional regulator [Clostridium tagluense]MCB2297353.1 MarR family transcriptional regulator [Clostridium tagluense]
MEKESLMYNISRIYRKLQFCLENKMKEYDLDRGLYIYLSHLLLQGEMNQQELAKAVNRDKAPTARAVERLILMGYIEKIISEEDKRSNKLYITPKAENIKQTLLQTMQTCEDDVLIEFSLEERQTFICLCQKFNK